MGLFSFIARLGLDGSNFETGILRAQGVGQKFAGFLKSEVGGAIAGAFSVGAVVAFGKSVINAADNIGDLADQLNITTDDVQRLQVLATQTGVKFEKMSGAILKVNEARAKALEGDGPERKAFASLGVSLGMLSDRNTTNLQLVEKIGQGYLASGKSVEKQAALTDLLSVKLVTAAGAIADIQKLGPIKLISEDQIKKLSEANDKLDEAKRRAIVAGAPLVTGAFNTASSELELANQAAERGQSASARFGGGIIGTAAGAAAAAGEYSQAPGMRIFKILASLGLFGSGSSQSAASISGQFNQPAGNINIGQTDPLAATKFNLGQSSDPYSKIGIFTQFGAQQDRMIVELRDQKRELAFIRKATEATAKVVTQ